MAPLGRVRKDLIEDDKRDTDPCPPNHPPSSGAPELDVLDLTLGELRDLVADLGDDRVVVIVIPRAKP
jgi:hypothetical protein